MATNNYFGTILIGIASVIGTPAAGGFMMYSNEKRRNNPSRAKKWLLISLLITLAFALPLFLLHAYLPILLFPFFAGGLMYIFAEVKQGEYLKKESTSVQTGSLLTHLLPGIVLTGLLGAGIYFTQQQNAVQQMNFGTLNHQVHYTPGMEDEAREVGELLLQTGHFGNAFATYVHIEAQNDTTVILFPVEQVFWDQPEWTDYAAGLKQKIETTTDHPYQLRAFDIQNNRRIEAAF